MNKFLKENWFKLSVLIIIAAVGSSVAYYCFYTLTKKENYKLQAMCSKKADEFFSDYISGRTYTVHYNRKLNKCFGLTEEYLHGDGFSDYTINLFEVYEGKLYGTWQSYVGKTSSENIFRGSVADKECTGQLEFRQLVKPYMEE